MYSIQEIDQVVSSPEFKEDLSLVHQALGLMRFGQAQLFEQSAIGRLKQFVECVLASAPDWDLQQRSHLCRTAAEVAEVLSGFAPKSKRDRFRAILLYELANLPAISQSLGLSNGLPSSLTTFFGRTGAFSSLMPDARKIAQQDVMEAAEVAQLPEMAMQSDTSILSRFLQTQSDSIPDVLGSDILARLAAEVAVGYSATDLRALSATFRKRASTATRENVGIELLQSLRMSGFPVELWPIQAAAVHGGLLDANVESWGLAAPTGAGKTFLTQLLIIDTLQHQPTKKVLYLAPSRALVYEIATKLSHILEPLAYSAIAVTPQLLELDDDEGRVVEEASVIVLTPEKADMLLRLGLGLFEDLSLVIVDEAHHLESSTRGILLEMYLWRLKTLIGKMTRFVFLSAVTPNIGAIASWISPKSQSLVFRDRPTRMRAGTYRISGVAKAKKGEIEYTDGVRVTVVDSPTSGVRKQLIQLAAAMSKVGSVLIVAKGKRECENLAKLMAEWLDENDGQGKTEKSEILERLDATLEREMYPDVLLRTIVKKKVAYHHAGLPPRVRIALEDAIRKRLVEIVFATTTLAEGVNFPFSTVIVQALAIREAPQAGRPARYNPVTPRVFWNLAGRAGRPGFDREGQVILFEPTLGLDKIEYVIGDYYNPELTAAEPVESALARCMKDVAEEIDKGDLALSDLGNAAIPTNASRRVQGGINLIRVSLLHAKAANLIKSFEDILQGTFASTMMQGKERQLATDIFALQDSVVDAFLSEANAPSVETAAQLGLSIETLTDIKQWVSSLEDWQIERLNRMLPGGEINFDQAKYFIGPVAKHMAELEGPKLGGFLSEVILQWLSGAPFTLLRTNLSGALRTSSIEDLIALIYSRVQFLLPWGLYAADKLVETEAANRQITYLNELRSIAYLVDSGVSNFDAMRLVHMEFERTDAQRLSVAYRREGGLRLGIDVISWLKTKNTDVIKRLVRGSDNRRLDYDLEARVSAIRTTA